MSREAIPPHRDRHGSSSQCHKRIDGQKKEERWIRTTRAVPLCHRSRITASAICTSGIAYLSLTRVDLRNRELSILSPDYLQRVVLPQPIRAE
jgi:hypothetical protein